MNKLFIVLAMWAQLSAVEEVKLNKSVHEAIHLHENAKLADIKQAASEGVIHYMGFDSDNYYFLCLSPTTDDKPIQEVLRIFSVARKGVKLPDVVNLHYELFISKEQEEKRSRSTPHFIELSDWSREKKLQRAFPVDIP